MAGFELFGGIFPAVEMAHYGPIAGCLTYLIVAIFIKYNSLKRVFLVHKMLLIISVLDNPMYNILGFNAISISVNGQVLLPAPSECCL